MKTSKKTRHWVQELRGEFWEFHEVSPSTLRRHAVGARMTTRAKQRGIGGLFLSAQRRILFRSGIDANQRRSIIAHELAHFFLDGKKVTHRDIQDWQDAYDEALEKMR